MIVFQYSLFDVFFNNSMYNSSINAQQCALQFQQVIIMSKIKIGDYCRKQIRANKTPAQIIKMANKRENGRKVNKAHIAWYVWDMRKAESKHHCDLPSNYAK